MLTEAAKMAGGIIGSNKGAEISEEIAHEIFDNETAESIAAIAGGITGYAVGEEIVNNILEIFD
jgi:hypothetical protein